MPAKVESYINQTNDVKNSVRAATTENITLSGFITVDGVTLSQGDRVLVKNQTISSNNGIYIVKNSSWTRSNDANNSLKVTSGMLVLVEEGDLNADSSWLLTTNNPITLGSTPLSFANFTSHTHSGADIVSGTVDNARLSSNAQAAINLYLWSNFR